MKKSAKKTVLSAFVAVETQASEPLAVVKVASVVMGLVDLPVVVGCLVF
jgi:hypothetical protein